MYAHEEFGEATVRRWLSQISIIEDRLHKYPESFTPVAGLEDMDVIYRGCTIMHNFKLIYHYDKSTDTVNIENIWDMRRKPAQLVELFKK